MPPHRMPSSASLDPLSLNRSLNRSTSPATDPSPHSAYLSALRQIDSIPVPDLASTLTNPADDEAPLSFERTLIDPYDDPRASSDQLGERRRRLVGMSESRNTSHDDRSRRERLERVLTQLNRMHQGSYDWTSNSSSNPAGNDVDEDREIRDYVSAYTRMREQQPHAPGELVRVMAQASLERERSRHGSSRSANQSSSSSSSQQQPQPPPQQETSLRSTAMQQAVRRYPRFSTRSRDYHSDRGTAAADNSTQTEYYDHYRQILAERQSLPQNNDSPRPRARRAVLRDTSSDLSTHSSSRLQKAFVYLANLRSSASYEDGVSYALKSGFTYKDFLDQNFVLDLRSIPNPVATSLLSPGSVFSGSQHAHSSNTMDQQSSSQPSLHLLTSNSIAPTQAPPSSYVPWLEDNSEGYHHSSLPSSSSWRDAAALGSPNLPNQQVSSPTLDHWPVEVTIFSVDYDRLTLSASMEAYGVPSHPQPSPSSPQCNPASSSQHEKSITTYLEGELLDFRTHTFITENFASNPHRDMMYWSKLQPFRSMSEYELPGRILQRDFLVQLQQKYVLMRWKERCFVHQSQRGVDGDGDGDNIVPLSATEEAVLASDGSGLTISGFYYVTLRREDGEVEGLYCDPQGTPYQYLKLKREGSGGFPAWGFK